MAKKMRNWLGPLVEQELKPAVEWVTDRTSSEKVVKQEFPEVKVTSRKEAFDPPSIDWNGPTIRQQWLDEGNTLRIKLERTNYELSTVQIIKVRDVVEHCLCIANPDRSSIRRFRLSRP